MVDDKFAFRNVVSFLSGYFARSRNFVQTLKRHLAESMACISIGYFTTLYFSFCFEDLCYDRINQPAVSRVQHWVNLHEQLNE